MSPLRRYLAWFAPHWGVVLLSALLLSLAAALPAATVFLLQLTVDRVLVGGESVLLGPLCIGFAAVALLRAVVTLGRTRLTKGVAWRVTAELRGRLHHHFLALDDPESVGSRLAALLSEVDELQYGVSALVTALRNPLTLVGLGASALWLAPQLAPWALLLLPPVVLAARWSGHRVHRAAAVAREARAELGGLAADQLGARELIASQGAVGEESARFERVAAADRDARHVLEVERVLPSALTAVVVSAAAAALLWVGGRQVLAGALEPGELVGFAVALGLMHRPLGGLAEVWALWQRSLAALDRVQEVLARPLPADPADPTPLPDGPLALEAEGIRASWGDEPVLLGASLTVRPGEIVALVGPSGAGKSTLLSVLAGDKAPESGQVCLGGVDLGRVRRADRRAAIARVAQESSLLHRSVRENLRLGRPEATEAELEDALRRAGADFLFQGRDGLDTPVGEKGSQLSGGERQRLCLARALLGGPGVLLLDEATNQVDPDTERSIVRSLRELGGEVAVLWVAHDPATARLADRVLRLEEGRIVPAASSRVA